MSDDLRELDAQVAERIMGWLPPSHADTVAMRGRQFMSHSTYDGLYLSPLGEIRQVPRYSSDIAAAMEVVERLQIDGYDVEMLGHDGWYVVFRETHAPTPKTFGATLPEAICRAALKAVVETEE